jgi:predicted Fe-S protein YdhL (DUF1289 family)
MTDEIWRRDEIESPCVKVCVVDPRTGLCLGCHRTVEEIAGWSAMTPEARRVVMVELPERAKRTKPVRRGGRAARRGE